jgi:hypothetical protein
MTLPSTSKINRALLAASPTELLFSTLNCVTHRPSSLLFRQSTP